METTVADGPNAVSEREKLQNRVAAAVREAFSQIGGSTLESEAILLQKIVHSGVSVAKEQSEVDGKPHDVEVRSVLTFFHQLNHRRKRRRETDDASHSEAAAPPGLVLKSDLGLERTVGSPAALATLICGPLEEICRREKLSYDVRPAASSGLINIVTPQRASHLRAAGRLPCPSCTKWCKGEKGLWWHQQREHESEHSEAAARAASERTVLALVPYGSDKALHDDLSPMTSTSRKSCSADSDDFFRWAREGNLKLLKECKEANGQSLLTTGLDRKGASVLHWATGAGHLHVTRFLVEECGMDPNQPQRGKRGFLGRTPLHWAARNGHLAVVDYLLSGCSEQIDIDAETADGTTAFGWAAWQAHLPILKLLRKHGCNVLAKNSFGCNAVLWVAQSEAEEKSQHLTLEWLREIGCNIYAINTNGHGALHKAAQRGRVKIVEWLLSQQEDSGDTSLDWIGPDSDGCCASDLAGMAGHIDLATKIADFERSLLRDRMKRRPNPELPLWLLHHQSQIWRSPTVLGAWEPNMGVARLRREFEGFRD